MLKSSKCENEFIIKNLIAPRIYDGQTGLCPPKTKIKAILETLETKNVDYELYIIKLWNVN